MADDNRPYELQIAAVSTVERDALPLLSAMVYGEVMIPEMLNKLTMGLFQPGLLKGFTVSTNLDMTITISIDKTLGYGAAIVRRDNQHFHIIQQHNIDVEMTTGTKWVVVLDVFYELATLTSQVHADATQEAVFIKAIKESEVSDEQIIICEVDLTGSPTKILNEHVLLTNRNDSVLTALYDHMTDPNAHSGSDLKDAGAQVNYINDVSDKIELGSLNIFMNPMEFTLPYYPDNDVELRLAVHPNISASSDRVTLLVDIGGFISRNDDGESATIYLDNDNDELTLYSSSYGWWCRSYYEPMGI